MRSGASSSTSTTASRRRSSLATEASTSRAPGTGCSRRSTDPRGVRCAQALNEAVKGLGVEIRAGAHTGEITRAEHGVAGLGVHVAARVASMARANEVWTSSTVKDLTAGSGLTFEDAGDHELKGVPDRWRLYRVVRTVTEIP